MQISIKVFGGGGAPCRKGRRARLHRGGAVGRHEIQHRSAANPSWMEKIFFAQAWPPLFAHQHCEQALTVIRYFVQLKLMFTLREHMKYERSSPS
ncbi:hypothetical protein [Vandammella animalimorsus]|uniref:hypothetical protein n=1 Tax=Vandammella animalimorsus TaxID=2029117 RepID=UPI00117D7B33|nr:hypothetical protein [Vandammella animalimorsus]